MSQLPYAQSDKAAVETRSVKLPDWFADLLHVRNADFEQRVVHLPEHASWQPTGLTGVDIRVLEYVPGDRPRLSAQLRIDIQHDTALPGNLENLEILVQRGAFNSILGALGEGMYLRIPASRAPSLHPQSIAQEAGQHRKSSALLYLSSGHMLESDTEPRCINTDESSRWLPGPIEQTEVLPLHGHGSANVMLIRWTGTVAFKSRIDPRGEEVLVLQGALYDANGCYPAGSWIRNPIVAWQSWGAKAGTIIYYKNGHFATSSLVSPS